MGVLTTTGVFAGLKLSTVMIGAAGGVSALAAVRAGQGQDAAAQTNAALLTRQAERERQIGALNARRVRDRGASLAATQRALLAGGGGDASTGSALLIQEDLAEEIEFNARLAESNADEAVFGRQAQAVIARSEGRNAQTASFFRAGTTLLNTGVNMKAFG